MKKIIKIIINKMNIDCLRSLAIFLTNNGVKSVIVEGDNSSKTVSLFLRAFGFTEIDPADIKDKVKSVIIDNNGFHFEDFTTSVAPAPTPAATVTPGQTTIAFTNNAIAKLDVATHLKFEVGVLAKELRKDVKNATEPVARIKATTKFVFVHCSADGVSDEELLLRSLANKAKAPDVVFTAIVGTWAEKVLKKSGLRLRKIYPNFKRFKKSKAFANALNEAWNGASACVFFAKSEAEAKQGKDIAFKAVSKRYDSNARPTLVVFQDDKKWFLFK